jgi:hypothetical protein
MLKIWKYGKNSENGDKKFDAIPVPETQKLAECVFDVRTLLQQILTDPVPSGLNGSCQKMVRTVLSDAHRAYVACFHAFYPTGYLKWACLCNLVSISRHAVSLWVIY